MNYVVLICNSVAISVVLVVVLFVCISLWSYSGFGWFCGLWFYCCLFC